MIRDDIMWGPVSRPIFLRAYSMHGNCKMIKGLFSGSLRFIAVWIEIERRNGEKERRSQWGRRKSKGIIYTYLI